MFVVVYKDFCLWTVISASSQVRVKDHYQLTAVVDHRDLAHSSYWVDVCDTESISRAGLFHFQRLKMWLHLS